MRPDHISDTENVGGSPLSGDQRDWPKKHPQPLQPLAGQHIEMERRVAKTLVAPVNGGRND